MDFVERLPQTLQRRLSRREPTLTLQRRNLYILPSRFGGLWMLTGAILYLVGINGRSNGPVLLSLLLLGLLLLNLFLTHFNLQGLELRLRDAGPSCADEAADVPLLAISRSARPAIKLRWLSPALRPQEQQLLHLQAGNTPLSVPWQPRRRGLQRPGRLLIHTTAPMGLFRCWSYWEPPLDLAIAPARTPGPVLERQRPEQRQPGARQSSGSGSEHFDELRPLRPEEGLQRVAWKTVARGQGWYGKRFEAEQAAGLWLAPAPSLPLERALEHLCERLCRGLQAGESLGLLLPGGLAIPPAAGQAQLQRCLVALASVPA
ncbi:MAG: DUF58 domain-containing protein [Cyanobacteria bacterium K_DeepCast_35m_m2_023]|nr:DUF58 domain-containing protein [Cyanobacteria bacterium K_DeepCast_35m_m2_023]